MTSFKNRRVVIASLFLPSTVVLGESPPVTPPRTRQREEPAPLTIPTTAFRVADKSKSPPPVQIHIRAPSIPAPLISIVEDLKDKVYIFSPGIKHTERYRQSRNATPAVLSPRSEQSNPFVSLLGEDFASHPPVSRKHQTTHIDSQSSPRIQRKTSRSSSRRSDSGSAIQPCRSWHIEQNPHCNGGLKNAIESVSSQLQKKLWVGTLGTNTDKFGEVLRNDIDRKMLRHSNSLPIWIPDAEFESCYDEFCHQVCFCVLSSGVFEQLPTLNPRFFGHVFTTLSPMLQKRSSSTSQLLTNSMSPLIKGLPTLSSRTTETAILVRPCSPFPLQQFNQISLYPSLGERLPLDAPSLSPARLFCLACTCPHWFLFACCLSLF